MKDNVTVSVIVKGYAPCAICEKSIQVEGNALTFISSEWEEPVKYICKFCVLEVTQRGAIPRG